ncbi:hypothetical protein K474DRAFT_1656386 [Panus rudis PR-1116 ss-1]|nr:hypothetical protein K474DRAFT_1666655 [Panus rudis PR-1116 ss-1]KAI0079502.1 hypothetical protein K474DRAFT_1659101 [Panus rudis PR-1116 ss-1]KAI0081586.1 hypothetical protein K474DRAFT_1656386 [Panus rudis PR-1116 ss-1]
MYNATVILPGGSEGGHCGIPTLSRAGLVPPPSRSSLPRRRCRSSHSSHVNPSPAVLDPRPNERKPVLKREDTPEDASGQVAADGDAYDASEMRPGARREGAAVSGKKAHKILTFPWRGG